MNTPADNPRSLAVTASWFSLGLAVGCACGFVAFSVVDQQVSFAHTGQGVLTGVLPRCFLYVMWAGEALAIVAGAGSFLSIRRNDIVAGAIAGIVARSLCGIAAGLFAGVILWLYVGHRVTGF